jgi:hypothetical protein
LTLRPSGQLTGFSGIRAIQLAFVSPSQSKVAEAIDYALNHWDGLTPFLRDGRVEVDSNTVERSTSRLHGKTQLIIQR